STGVYGEVKEKDPYTEFDEVHPTTIHHSSKCEAEKIVKNHLNRYLILRTGWLFGGEKTHSKNFVYKRYLEASNNNVIYSDDSQIGNPTCIKDLVRQIQILIESNQVGVFNCVNKAFSVSRYDYVKKIVSLLDLSCEVKKVSSDFFIRKAKVSKNESAKNYKLELLNLNIMENWDSALNKYIAQIVRDLK
ncbi:MAG: sugar nucleotide-binding protein, partial [Colwellia sp.]